MRLIDAPVGLFLHDGALVLKTEYSTVRNDAEPATPDCYILGSGEYFWGGAKTAEERNALEVTPVDSSSVVIVPDRPLTLEEIRQMGGKPYWHVGLQEASAPPHWAILDPIYARHIEDYFYGERWVGYRRPPKDVPGGN